ncbi:MAG: ABC transporter ATP-binding protein [Chryseolinea sp.]
MISLIGFLTLQQRRDGIRVAFLMCINAILDFFSLALFLPLIILVISPEYIRTNVALNNLYTFLRCSSAATFIVYMTLAVLVIILLKNILAQWITQYKARYIFNIGSELSQRMVSRYAQLDYVTFTTGDFSKELNRITNLPLAFANNIVMPMTILVSEGLVTMFLVTSATVYDVKIFIFLLIILLPIMIVYRFRRKHLEALGRSLKDQYPKTMKYALQIVEGLPDIKAFGKQDFFEQKFKDASMALSETMRNEHIVQTRSSRTTETIAAVVICSIVIYSVLTSQAYSHTITLLSIYAGVSFRIFPSINRLLNASFQLRTHAYLFEELKPLNKDTEKLLPPPAPSRTFEDQIELRNIAFEYRTGVSVLNDISFNIHKGEKLGLVGKSGSGKTTLLMLILQLLELRQGELLLDSELINNNDPSWKTLFAYVAQNPYIIDGTISENIAFGHAPENYSIDKIWIALTLVDMRHIVKQYPNGIHTNIGEKGIQLSGGQRQRIALARALYTDAPVLLFDEITNHLDAITETEIIKTIHGLSKAKKTIVMITHRQDLLKHFDRVLTLENGNLHEKPSVAESSL